MCYTQVTCLELPSPKLGSPYKSGLEHAELVVKVHPLSFMDKCIEDWSKVSLFWVCSRFPISNLVPALVLSAESSRPSLICGPHKRLSMQTCLWLWLVLRTSHSPIFLLNFTKSQSTKSLKSRELQRRRQKPRQKEQQQHRELWGFYNGLKSSSAR